MDEVGGWTNCSGLREGDDASSDWRSSAVRKATL
jgi:hypothetical protein